MVQKEFFEFADNLAKEAGTENGQHQYFLSHKYRLWVTASHFDIWKIREKEILEIGPFFSYIPFVLREQGNRVTVLEGDDPSVLPLDPLHRAREIPVIITDLFENFGAANFSRHRLPFADNQFDIVNCWETMEHFNFNPVGFLKEVRRILKPGGMAFVTVPNVARLESRIRLFFGKPIGPLVSSYAEFYEYHGGKFLGWHWREYVLSEFVELFVRLQFRVEQAAHLLTFTHYPRLSAARKARRLFSSGMFRLFPSTGTICAVRAVK
ncbi:MAG TPA: class I SAM-dependent methyltransferase [Verrucomicrobiae bacterium]|nr:class I SAM-dependent methyltransferase [Verrucomicrobiae bacterium]